jgi:energy-coupling factor transporter transmembrane protein EcfT
MLWIPFGIQKFLSPEFGFNYALFVTSSFVFSICYIYKRKIKRYSSSFILLSLSLLILIYTQQNSFDPPEKVDLWNLSEFQKSSSKKEHYVELRDLCPKLDLSFDVWVRHQSTDIKGRDNSHTSVYVALPLVPNDWKEEQGVQWLAILGNRFLLTENWAKECPKIGVIIPRDPDQNEIRKEFRKKNRIPLIEPIYFVRIYKSLQDYLNFKESFFILISFFPTSLWFFVVCILTIKKIYKLRNQIF